MKTRFLILFAIGIIIVSGIILIFNFDYSPTYAQEQSPNIRVEDPNFTPQDFRTGETLSNPWVAIVIEGLGAVLIILFIVIYAVKKKKGVSKHDNN